MAEPIRSELHIDMKKTEAALNTFNNLKNEYQKHKAMRYSPEDMQYHLSQMNYTMTRLMLFTILEVEESSENLQLIDAVMVGNGSLSEFTDIIEEKKKAA